MDEIRKTTSGTIRGTVTDGIASFLGVPYAAAPVGERRFALPAPISWDGERDATVHGANAAQLPPHPGMPDITPITGPGWVPGAEYLTADVRTPATGDLLPVMVFVHGGAFTIGR
ncbi:hypothetical protein Acsp06_61260 [Actinomycetospora sp. NBRC 106375]|uniref:carboxylesterase family protein n=1 Tax=Actinomycetospora sp. NBRC 106375 TaxID=3032207 RepID=UPI0024A055C3|nr:carboxylesterase family protein [Actinomycetospora sp. NBRC 106375]GLZ49941.1 hypothetical protein Acsp06_61260 [Actinomycetospora sp. NBRC 106375]